MIIRFNKKVRDDLVAIKNYINEFPGEINEIEFMDFIISFEYYPVYYKNYHIIRDLVGYHNSHLQKVQEKVNFEQDDNLEDLLGI